MTKKTRCSLPVLLGLASLVLPTCALAQKVRTDYDHAANFEKYKTYKWVQVQDAPQVSQLAEQRITGAIDAALAKEGLVKTENNPDLLVERQVSLTTETQLNTYSTGTGGYGYGARWGYGWGDSGISTTTATKIPVGTLVVELLDPAQKQLIFRGTATDTLSDKPEKNTKKINKAVEKIFEKYPPKEKK
jgi:hypothetical protein